MKLADWAKKSGISYITAYRWFKEGSLPVKSYQTDSGTIIVEEGSDIKQKLTDDSITFFLKNVVVFSSNGSSVDEFASFILSNFNIKLKNIQEKQNQSKIKPSKETIQSHIEKFLVKKEKPKPNIALMDEFREDNDVSLDGYSK